jgi:hypothetical protein
MRLLWFTFSLCAIAGFGQEDIKVTIPTPGTDAQKTSKDALESRMINKLNDIFPNDLFERDIDFAGWTNAMNPIVQFVTMNSRYDASIYSALGQTTAFSDLLLHIIQDVKAHKLAVQEAASKLDALYSAFSTAKPPTFSNKKQRESMELITSTSSYLKASTEGVAKVLKAPGFDIINKSGSPIYVLVVNDPAGYGKGKSIKTKEGDAVEVEVQKNFTKRINIKKKTLVLVYKTKPNISVYDLKIEKGLELPCEHAYLIDEATPETIYVSYSDEKGLYPQTGKLGGWWGTTSGGFTQGKNITPSHIKEACIEQKAQL